MLDCIIVGAGFSGLSAAVELEKAQKSVLVLEARDRVGGRTKPHQFAGHQIDLGGMWLGPSQKRLAGLAENFQIRTYPQPLHGRNHLKINGRSFRTKGEAFEKSFSIFQQLHFQRITRKFDRLCAAMPLSAPWDAPEAKALDSMNVTAWCDRHVRSKDVRDMIDFLVRAIFCAEPYQISMLYFLWYLKSGGGLEVLASSSDGGAQNFLFHGGVHQIAVKLSQQLSGELHLEEPVIRIEQSPDAARIHTQKSSYDAARVIVATPPGLTSQIVFEPDLPHLKRGLLQRQPMGSCIKVWIAYDAPFWRDEGSNGLIADTGHGFSPVFDATPPESKTGLLAGFFDGSAADQWSGQTPQKRRAEVMEVLTAALGPQAAQPLDYIEQDWTNERWSQGCYGAYMGPGVLTIYGQALRAPVGRIHWAGTESAAEWLGYIEGAIESGRRAANEVLQ